MIAARMSWINELGQFVPSGSLNKGRNYFRSGSVQIDQGSADRVEATVRGGGRYSLVIDLQKEEETLVVSCTCPHYEDINICKHIWAALLAAEAEGHLKQIADMGQPFIETEIEYESDDGDDERDDFDEDFGVYPVCPDCGRRHPAAPAKQARKVDPWKEHLANLRAATPVQSPGRSEGKRRIVYMADVVQSLSARGLIIQAAVCRLKKDGGWGKPAFQENSIREVSKLEHGKRQGGAFAEGRSPPRAHRHARGEPFG